MDVLHVEIKGVHQRACIYTSLTHTSTSAHTCTHILTHHMYSRPQPYTTLHGQALFTTQKHTHTQTHLERLQSTLRPPPRHRAPPRTLAHSLFTLRAPAQDGGDARVEEERGEKGYHPPETTSLCVR